MGHIRVADFIADGGPTATAPWDATPRRLKQPWRSCDRFAPTSSHRAAAAKLPCLATVQLRSAVCIFTPRARRCYVLFVFLGLKVMVELPVVLPDCVIASFAVSGPWIPAQLRTRSPRETTQHRLVGLGRSPVSNSPNVGAQASTSNSPNAGAD